MGQTHYERSVRLPRWLERERPRWDAIVKAGASVEEVPFMLLAMLRHETDERKVSDISRRFSWACREATRTIMKQQSDLYSYMLLAGDPRYGRLMSGMMRMAPASMIVPSMMVDYYGVAFEEAGRRCYDVHPDLAARLAQTELRGLGADDLRLPYEAVYLIVPPTANLKVWNRDTEWHRVDGIYIIEDRHSRKMGEGEEPIGPEFRSWRMMVCGEPKGTMGIGNVEVPDDAISYFNIPLFPGRSLDSCIEEAASELEAAHRRRSGLWDIETADTWREQFRWAMNVMLYCTWEEPGEHWEANREARQLWERIKRLPGNSRKRGSLQAKLQGMERQPRLRIGYSTVVRRGQSEPEATERSAVFSGSNVKTRVAGHWKRQACGPGLVDRKLIWIQPYWRNQDGEERGQEPVHAVR